MRSSPIPGQIFNTITRTSTITRGCSSEIDLSDKYLGESWPQAYRSCEVRYLSLTNRFPYTLFIRVPYVIQFSLYFRTQNSQTYSVSVCNNGNYCESRCSNPFLPQMSTASPWIEDDASSNLSIILSLILVALGLIIA